MEAGEPSHSELASKDVARAVG
ncbi:unnamed protein product [Linum tenue]|uniref:Uncharacterized protein n=1 Tax=Linum tenue TaxID=586396 RepID=A0AAV0NVQ3_9ROSI|nr:unnamed protein product [Linum tenue]CAI0462913.1 unnamed protein product [Linum tenue]